jgi:N-methylhydantoinase B
VRNGVIAVTEEMKTNLMRTAYNIIIYEALDFTTGLFTPRARRSRSASAADVHPRHVETVKAKISTSAARTSSPATSTSPTTLSHRQPSQPRDADAADLPQGKLVGFSCCMAHWLDIGGNLGGMSTESTRGPADPDHEAARPGTVNETLTRIIRQNVRIPTRAMGDLRAQVTAVKTGERRFLQLHRSLRARTRARRDHAIMDHAEAMARRARARSRRRL